MAQYDVYALPDASGYVVDCQSNLLRDLTTRFVIPLAPVGASSEISPRLNPRFRIGGSEYFLDTRYVASIPRGILREPVASLEEHDHRIISAIDMLVRGF